MIESTSILIEEDSSITLHSLSAYFHGTEYLLPLYENGVLLGSVPNALSLEKRIATMIGINTHWDKKKIIDGVFGGYGHIREYAIYEVRNLLSTEFTNITIYGYSPYGRRVKLYFLNVVPHSMRSIIFFEATKISSKSLSC